MQSKVQSIKEDIIQRSKVYAQCVGQDTQIEQGRIRTWAYSEDSESNM